MVGLWEFESQEIRAFGVLRHKLQKGRTSEPRGRTSSFGILEDLQIEKSG
jgi:hypothetical protein